MKAPALTCFLLFWWAAIASAQPFAAEPGPAELARNSPHNGQPPDRSELQLRSRHALVIDAAGNELYAKAADQQVSIASITKLMTAMVTLDAELDPQERITISAKDRDRHKLTGSRLQVGATLRRSELLHLALMSSENRAASALARNYPGGSAAFVEAMNRKALELQMGHTHFVDSTGLNEHNRSTARDLALMVRAAEQYPFIRKATTSISAEVHPWSRQAPLHYHNTNRLIGKNQWPIRLSKTGYTSEAGRCLVMSLDLAGRPLVVVLLDAYGTLTPLGDSSRLRSWLERASRTGRPS